MQVGTRRSATTHDQKNKPDQQHDLLPKEGKEHPREKQVDTRNSPKKLRYPPEQHTRTPHHERRNNEPHNQPRRLWLSPM